MDTHKNYLLNHINQYIQLDTLEIDLLTNAITAKNIKKNDFLLRAGRICTHHYFITSGCVKKYYTSTEGKERIFEFSTEHEWIGDLNSCWQQKPSIFDIKAIENVEVILLERTKLLHLFSKIPKLESYFRMIGDELIAKQERRIKQSLACSAAERYDDFISDYPGMEQRLSQKEIAAFIGISPEFLSTLRNKKNSRSLNVD